MAQNPDFNVPGEWRKPNSTLPFSSRLLLAQDALSPLTTTTNFTSNNADEAPGDWQYANLLANIAQLDYVSGAQANHNLVRTNISAFQTDRPTLFDSQAQLNDSIDPLMWGLAAFYGSRAYNDTDLWNAALNVWTLMQAYVISNQAISENGTLRTMDGASVDTGCPPSMNSTLTGGVLRQAMDLDDVGSDALTVGAYIALSAHLWDATGNLTYLTAANDSARFVQEKLYSPHPQTISDSFNFSTCVAQDARPGWTIRQGFLMEGLSILSQAASSTWLNSLKELVNASIKFPEWTSQDKATAGVIVERPTQHLLFYFYRNIFINALLEIWSRTSASDPMAIFIEAFVSVQFNALQDLASNNSLYSPVWTGPPPLSVDPQGQLAAIPVLNTAIKLVANSSSATVDPSSTSPVSSGIPSSSQLAASRSSKSLSGGDIAGIIIGSIAGAILLIVGAFFARRYMRRLAEKHRRVLIPSFDRSAMYAPRQNPEGAAGQLPAGHIVKDRRGFGLGETYAGSPPPGDADSARPPSALPFPVEKATATTT